MALNECADPTSYLKLVKLHTAISSEIRYKKGLKCIERILEQDGDINYKIPNTDMLKSCNNLVGCTILHRHFCNIQPDILSQLLNHGADFTINTPEGHTVIHDYINSVSWRYRGHDWSSSLDSPVVALILSAYLKRQITENPVDSNGLSHFHAACMTNNVEAIEFFLDNGVSIEQRVNVDSPVFAGYTPLHFAVRFNCLEAVKSLLQRGANIDVRDTEKLTPLHNMIIPSVLRQKRVYGISEKCIDIVEEIVECYQIHNAQDHFGLSHLHLLCISKDSSRLERHLNDFENVNCAVNVDSPFCPGFTPLHFAALFNLDSVKLLLAKGGDITIKNVDEETPLDLCIARYGIEDIHDIIARSTFKDVRLSNGKTKLTDLLYSMRSPSDFSTLLREFGDANAHIPADSLLWPGHAPLHLAIIFHEKLGYEQSEMLAASMVECLKNGFDILAKGALDQTPLQFAFRHSCADAVDLMLQYHRGTSNLIDEGGLSHLHIACAAKDKRTVEALLDRGADVNCKLGSTFAFCPKYRSAAVFYGGSTPLHVAVAVGDHEMMRLFLNRGADLQAQDARGMSPIHRLFLSSGRESWELLDELLSSENLRECVADSCGLSHLHVACHAKHLDAVKKLLLQPECQVNQKISCKDILGHYDGCTPLLMAMQLNNYGMSFEVVDLLLEHGADILADGDWEKAPLYHVMTSFGYSPEDCYWKVFVAAIRRDQDLRRRVDERVPGLTDLHLACYLRQDSRWVSELLAVGVDVNARIRDDSSIWRGCTPLHVLMKKRSEGESDTILQLLLDNGADVTIPGGHRLNTPLHLAEGWSSRPESTLPDVPCDRMSLMIRSIKDFTLNPTSVAGVSHFHIACWCLDVAAVEGFLKHGVDVNAKLDYFYDRMGGYTPLHVTLTRKASSPRKMRIVKLLLNHGADVHAESYSGNTALHYAAMYHANVGLPIFVMILKAGADINAKNVLGASPLEILLKEGKVGIDWMKCFIKRGCRINDFNCVSDEGLIPMIFDARKLQKQDVKAFLLKSPKIGEADEMGRSAIHNIVSIFSLNVHDHDELILELESFGRHIRWPTMDVRDYAELIEKLEKLGCDVDRQDKSGQTALHAAARFQNDPAIAALLAAGADISVVDAAGKTAFAYSLLERRVYTNPRPPVSEYKDVFSSHAVELFAAHVSKLGLAGLYIDALNERSQEVARNKIFGFRSMDENHFCAILDRVDNASVKVGSASMTLRDFVSANGPVWKYSKLRRMNRDYVVELFDTILDKRYEEKLDDLRCLVRLQYRNYLARSKLVETAKIALSVLANIPVPDLCSEAILAFCANWELKSVIEATN